MPDEPEVNRQVPRLPVFLKRPTIPPVHVKLPVCELQQLSNDVQENVEKAVKPGDPHYRVRD